MTRSYLSTYWYDMQYCVHQAYIFFTVGQLWDKLANLRSYYCKELKKVTD